MAAKKPFFVGVEVVRDEGPFEAPNERVVLLKTVGHLGQEAEFRVYAVGSPEDFKPGDRYDLVKRGE